MNEASLKAALCDLARKVLPKWVIQRHEDRFTHGQADITMTGEKRTSWIEVKYATPDFKSRGIQELTLSRLALAGFAYYVVYWEKDGEKMTFIVDPKDIGKPIEEWNRRATGFNHMFVIDFIRGVHSDNIRS